MNRTARCFSWIFLLDPKITFVFFIRGTDRKYNIFYAKPAHFLSLKIHLTHDYLAIHSPQRCKAKAGEAKKAQKFQIKTIPMLCPIFDLFFSRERCVFTGCSSKVIRHCFKWCMRIFSREALWTNNNSVWSGRFVFQFHSHFRF